MENSYIVKEEEYNVTIGNIIYTIDEPRYKMLEPKYTIVAFSTDDGNSLSTPVLYFIPCSIKIPDEISSTKRMAYEKNTGQRINKWLRDNAEHVIDAKHHVIVY